MFSVSEFLVCGRRKEKRQFFWFVVAGENFRKMTKKCWSSCRLYSSVICQKKHKKIKTAISAIFGFVFKESNESNTLHRVSILPSTSLDKTSKFELTAPIPSTSHVLCIIRLTSIQFSFTHFGFNRNSFQTWNERSRYQISVFRGGGGGGRVIESKEARWQCWHCYWRPILVFGTLSRFKGHGRWGAHRHVTERQPIGRLSKWQLAPRGTSISNEFNFKINSPLHPTKFDIYSKIKVNMQIFKLNCKKSNYVTITNGCRMICKC